MLQSDDVLEAAGVWQKVKMGPNMQNTKDTMIVLPLLRVLMRWPVSVGFSVFWLIQMFSAQDQL